MSKTKKKKKLNHNKQLYTDERLYIKINVNIIFQIFYMCVQG